MDRAHTSSPLKVTVLVAFFNAELFLKKCLESLSAQTMIDQVEVIAIGYKINAAERNIIQTFQQNTFRLKLLEVDKPGLYYAWNQGIKQAQGEYLLNLNADDRLAPNALAVMSETLDQHPEIGLVYANSYRTHQPNETFEHNSSHGEVKKLPTFSRKMLLGMCPCGSHPMWRHAIHEEFGYFDESFIVAGDWEFWLRIGWKYPFLHLPQVLGLYYHNPEGLQHGNPTIHSEEIQQIRRKYFKQYDLRVFLEER